MYLVNASRVLVAVRVAVEHADRQITQNVAHCRTTQLVAPRVRESLRMLEPHVVVTIWTAQ